MQINFLILIEFPLEQTFGVAGAGSGQASDLMIEVPRVPLNLRERPGYYPPPCGLVGCRLSQGDGRLPAENRVFDFDDISDGIDIRIAAA